MLGQKSMARGDYTPEERNKLAAELDRQLGPEFVATRPGQGGLRVSYIEGWKAINLANRIFGFDNWSSEVRSTTVDYVDETNGKFSVGLSTIVRVSLKNGVFHEDIGYGHIENARTRAMAFEKCKKEAMTDGLKRALRCFGNAMGNCLYDKTYLAKISKVKANPTEFCEDNLMRPGDHSVPQHQPKQQRPVAARPPVSIPLKAAAPPAPVKPEAPVKQENQASKPIETLITEEDLLDDSFADIPESDDFLNGIDDYEMALLLNKTAEKEPETKPPPVVRDDYAKQNTPAPNTASPRPMETPTPKNIPATVGFFSARAAEEVQNNMAPDDKRFNPNFISPSIRRTVDPTKSMPVKRSALQVADQNSSLKRPVGKPPTPLTKRIHRENVSYGSQSSDK